MNDIGKIYPSIFPFYDKKLNKLSYKSRPVLIIAEPIGFDTEYTVLPVSTMSNRSFYNPLYDEELKQSDYPLLKLNKMSYVRTHKQTTVYKKSIDFNSCIGDLKKDYNECYYKILDRLGDFNSKVKELG